MVGQKKFSFRIHAILVRSWMRICWSRREKIVLESSPFLIHILHTVLVSYLAKCNQNQLLCELRRVSIRRVSIIFRLSFFLPSLRTFIFILYWKFYSTSWGVFASKKNFKNLFSKIHFYVIGEKKKLTIINSVFIISNFLLMYEYVCLFTFARAICLAVWLWTILIERLVVLNHP